MTRIAQIANFYGPKSGGLKTSMVEIAKQYSHVGIECLQIVPGYSYSRSFTNYSELITIPGWKIPFSGGYRVIIGTKKIKEILTEYSPNLIEINDRLTLLGLANWARKKNIKTVLFAHEILINVLKTFFPFIPGLYSIVRWHNKNSYKKFDHVVATTNFAAQEFQEIGAENLSIIPLGVDREIFNENRVDYEIRNHEIFPKLAFKVLDLLVQNKMNPHLYVIGAGPLKTKLKEKYKNSPVTFIGYLSNRKMLAKYLASVDFVLAPGPNETFCLAALEALSCGTPVIASEKSALKEILANGGGSCVDENIENWAKEICSLLEENDLRSQAIKNASNYSWQKTAQSLLSLYCLNLPAEELVA
jgi:alpha-1,6-mannosyltransferase